MILLALIWCWCWCWMSNCPLRANHYFLLFLVICIFSAFPLSRRIIAATSSSSSSCPLDFQYVNNFPATLGSCRGSGADDVTVCCPALLNIFGIALSQYLALTGIFEFPDNATAFACLNAYQQQLHANAITKNFLTTCFPVPFSDPAMFVQSPSLCAGITTAQNWTHVVGASPMDNSCRGDLSSQAGCQICTDDIKQVVYKLNTISSNHSDCVYFSVIYAAGVVNTFGPLDPSSAICLLGINAKDQKMKKHRIKIGILISIAGGIVCLSSFLLAMAYWFWQRRKQNAELETLLEEENRVLMNSLASNTGLVQFTYDQLKAATQNFNPVNVIGEGGFGRVYRGVLGSDPALQIAVKMMKKTDIYGDTEFLNEVEVINRVRHRNLLHLRGCCVARPILEHHHKLLVYDYMPNGNLENYLFTGTKPLSWPQRRKIAVGMATGIKYLHNEVDPAIIHRDIKPSNILLDADLNAKVADFGLAKIAPEGISLLNTRVAGTPVYIALEYAMYGQLSEKVDVYSFGIVLLELMSGRRALDTTLKNPADFHIVDWAWRLVKQHKVVEVIDESIRDGNSNNPIAVMERFVYVAILCAHLLVTFRPPISQALKMLEGDYEIPPIPDRPLPYAWTKPGDPPSAYSFNSSCAHSPINSIDLLR